MFASMYVYDLIREYEEVQLHLWLKRLNSNFAIRGFGCCDGRRISKVVSINGVRFVRE